MNVSQTELIVTVLGGNIALVGALVFLAKSFGPQLFTWMKTKIDEKNGSITVLVDEVKRLSQGICALITQSNNQQDEFIAELRAVICHKDTQIDRLMQEMKATREGTEAKSIRDGAESKAIREASGAQTPA